MPDLWCTAAGASTINLLRQLGGAFGIDVAGMWLGARLGARAAPGPAGTLRAFPEVSVRVAVLTGAAALAAWQMKPPPPPPASPA